MAHDAASVPASVPAAPSPFEVYVHVPFCLRRCGYCDFNTYTAPDLGEGASRGNYARMAVREMELVRAWQEERGLDEPPACSVFFGGGTPTILPADDLVEMLDAVRRIWGLQPGAEVTTEANPDTVDADYIKRLADGGFTRISFGMQSAVPSVLRTLDRRHTPANVEAGVRAADACGLRSSVDLIYGAPGESLEDWRTSVRAAVDLGVNHISAYALTIAPRTKMGRMIAAGRLPKPSDDDEAAKYEIADELLSAAGLQWYEISNWARPGYESRHNLGYWRNVDWAGIGPGAHSHYRLSGGVAVADDSSARLSDVFPGDTGALGLAQGPSEGFRKTGAASDSRDSSSVPAADAPIDPASVGLRSWDVAHPRAWAHDLNAGRVPWAGSEGITPAEDAEETLMLGLRLHEGFDTSRFAGIIPRSAWEDLQSEGLLTLVNPTEPACDSLHGLSVCDILHESDHGISRESACGNSVMRSTAPIAVPTLRGRLLNDLIIERLYDYLP